MNKQIHEFISGTKYSFVDSIVRPRDGQVFKLGDLIEWTDPDSMDENNLYAGKINAIFIIEEKPNLFSIEISFDAPLGRVDLNDIELVESQK